MSCDDAPVVLALWSFVGLCWLVAVVIIVRAVGFGLHSDKDERWK